MHAPCGEADDGESVNGLMAAGMCYRTITPTTLDRRIPSGGIEWGTLETSVVIQPLSAEEMAALSPTERAELEAMIAEDMVNG